MEWYDDDLYGEAEAAIKGKLKSEEEIARYSLDDSLSELDKVLTILYSGTNEQKRAVLNNLEMYMEDDPAILSIILPKIYEAMENWPSSEHAPIADALSRLFDKNYISDEMAEKMMGTILNMIYDGNEDIVNIWHVPFFHAIPNIAWETFVDKFLMWVLKMAGLTQTLISRRAAARIIRAASHTAAKKDCFTGNLLQGYLELCEDPDISIRRETLTDLCTLLKYVSNKSAEYDFFPEIMQSMKDPNVVFRTLAIAAVLENHEKFPKAKLAAEFAPGLVKEIAKGWNESEPWILEHFSAVIYLLQERELVSESYVEVLHKFFDTALFLCGTKVTQTALKHIHAMADLYFSRNIDAAYETNINFFSQDVDYQPILAESLPNVYVPSLQVFSKYNKGSKIRPAFCEIIQTKDVKLLVPLVQSFPEIIPQLFPEGDEHLEKLFTLLKDLWLSFKKSSWRYITVFIKAVPSLQSIFTGHKFNEYFLDEFAELLRTAEHQVKCEASHAFCLFLRKCPFHKKRERLLGNVLVLKNSFSYYERVGFIEFCKASVEYFSQRFLRTHGIVSAMATLMADKVSVLKIRVLKAVVHIIPKVKEDMQYILIKKVNTLIDDKNKDVKYEAWKASKAIETIFKDKETYLDEVMEQDIVREKEEDVLIIKERKEEEEKKEQQKKALLELPSTSSSKRTNASFLLPQKTTKHTTRRIDKVPKCGTPKSKPRIEPTKKSVHGMMLSAETRKKHVKEQHSFDLKRGKGSLLGVSSTETTTHKSLFMQPKRDKITK